jgi:hypothetical protein
VELEVAADKDQLPENFPLKLLEDLDRLAKQYGPVAFHRAIQHRRRRIKGQPRKRSEILLDGVWHVVQSTKYGLGTDNVSEVCRFLARYAIIDKLNETCGFITAHQNYLAEHRKPPETWRRLYTEAENRKTEEDRALFRKRLSLYVSSDFAHVLRSLYEKMPKKTQGLATSEVQLREPKSS